MTVPCLICGHARRWPAHEPGTASRAPTPGWVGCCRGCGDDPYPCTAEGLDLARRQEARA